VIVAPDVMRLDLAHDLVKDVNRQKEVVAHMAQRGLGTLRPGFDTGVEFAEIVREHGDGPESEKHVSGDGALSE